MTTAGDTETAVGDTSSEGDRPDGTEPTLLDHWRFERRLTEPAPSTDWRSSVPNELFERIRARSAAAAAQSSISQVPLQASLLPRGEAAQAGQAPMPDSYRAPFLPDALELDSEHGWEPSPEPVLDAEPIRLPSAFRGLDWISDATSAKVLVSVRPIVDATLAERVVELLDRAPGMSSVRSLGSDGDVAAFDADYNGPVPGMEAVSQALRGIGASLVCTGDREFYLAIQGQAV